MKHHSICTAYYYYQESLWVDAYEHAKKDIFRKRL